MFVNPQIDLIVERIVKKFNPHKIILFGSYAKGTATKDSDVDLLIVLPIDEKFKLSHYAVAGRYPIDNMEDLSKSNAQELLDYPKKLENTLEPI